MDGRAKIILVASIVVNLFLAGALAGALVVGSRFVQERSEARGGDRPGMLRAVQAVPSERRQLLREVMRDQALAARPDLQAARQARRNAARLIGAETYDAAAVEAALKQAREADLAARAKIDTALAARLAELTPEDRAAFARVMMRGPRGGEGRGRGPRGPGGPPPPPDMDEQPGP